MRSVWINTILQNFDILRIKQKQKMSCVVLIGINVKGISDLADKIKNRKEISMNSIPPQLIVYFEYNAEKTSLFL